MDGSTRTTSKRRALLILRAGDRSLHESWFTAPPGTERNWDLHISYYGDKEDPYADRPADVTMTREKGGKFSGLDICLNKLGVRLDDYEYIGWPDDDLEASMATWNRFFEILQIHKPVLAQPSLLDRSYFSFLFTLQRKGVRLRWTNFVESMTPVFRRDALELARKHLVETKSGWGMDFLWPKLFEAEKKTVCIVDETPVLHTRRAGAGPLYKLLKTQGVETPDEEKEAFLKVHGVTHTPPVVYGVVNSAGQLQPPSPEISRRLVTPMIRQHFRNALSKLSLGDDVVSLKEVGPWRLWGGGS